jgi:hypothetical protein
MRTMNDRDLIENLLAALRYVQETGDIRDSIKNDGELADIAAQRLGFSNYTTFGDWCDGGDGLEDDESECTCDAGGSAGCSEHDAAVTG